MMYVAGIKKQLIMITLVHITVFTSPIPLKEADSTNCNKSIKISTLKAGNIITTIEPKSPFLSKKFTNQFGQREPIIKIVPTRIAEIIITFLIFP